MPTTGAVAAVVGALTAATTGVDQYNRANRGEKRAEQGRQEATSAMVSEKRAADAAMADVDRDTAIDPVAIEEGVKGKKTNKQRTTLGGNVNAYGTDPSAASLYTNPNLGTPT